jgi:homoserine O-acetyltransferase
MKIVILKLVALMAVALLTPSLAHAADETQPHEADVEVHDFTLQDGQRLPILKLHYTTLGTPKRDASGKVINAVVLLHGTTQTSKVFLALVGSI